jgi:peptidoglycan/xylan/chitin deacetylase (PgdA/CDA1 family)
MLAALAQGGVNATFFVSTAPFRSEADWRMCAEIAAAGHEIGFHCEQHIRHGERQRDEVAAGTRRALDELGSIGVTPQLWRTPWGRTAPWSAELAAEFGLELCNWSDDTHDWRGDSADEMLGRLRSTLSPGSIVLMHDGIGPGALREGCDQTLALIPELIALARERAAEVAPIGARSG